MPSILKSKKRIIRVGIDGGDFIPFSTVKSGIQRIIDSFVKEVCKLKNKNFIFNYYYFSPVGCHPTGVITYKRLPQKFFASFFLPLYFKKDNNDVFLGSSSYLPPLLNLFKTKKMVFLYDMGFFKLPNFYNHPQELINNTLEVVKNADKIIVLSEYVKKELVGKNYHLDERKIIHIYPGINHFEPVSINQLIDTKLTKYFLYVGVIKPIKKIEKLFEIFYYFLTKMKNKNYQLILIGQKEEKYFKKLLTNRYYLKLKEKIIFKENISDEELVVYYLNSTALVNFSYEEGFCFPVLEALSLGKTVIVNNLPIYYEFQDKFDNLLIGKNEKEIVQLMVKESKRFRKENRDKKSKENIIFKWRDFTEKLLEVIQQS